MNSLEFWQYKVLQTLHDPVDKMIVAGLIKHEKLALEQLEVVTGEKQTLPFKAPDYLASGADRPVVGGRNMCMVNWRLNPIITHPLQPETRMHVEWEAIPAGKGSKKKADDFDEIIRSALKQLALSSGQWNDPSHVRRLFLRLWRQFPEILRELGLQEPYVPADSRIPDHSIWDHNRVASAAAFLVEYTTKNDCPPEREPWMLAVTLGGVQRFISETRTTRDLWTASMIYSDLAWAAMRPIVETLGPDAVLYPDLRGNPTVDRWLLDECREAVPESVRETKATSFAAMLPNTFLVLAPRGGGDSGLPDLQNLAEECTQAIQKRWCELGDAVERWIVGRNQSGPGKWQEIWRRQMEGRYGEPPVTWAAIPWQQQMYGIGDAVRGPAIPGQSPNADRPELPEQLKERKKNLAPWLPHRIWSHYEMARDVFWHTDTEAGLQYLSNERGFDYPLVHHQLRTVLSMCKAQGAVRVAEEPGEKCSISGREQALTNGPQGNGLLVTRQRAGARRFWSGLDVEGTGMERLGSTAAIKRYLVQSEEPKFTETWETSDERKNREHKSPRVPFPSLAAIAAAKFIEDLSKKANEEISQAIRNYIQAFEATSLENTVDPRVLPAFIRASSVAIMKDFLTIEPEYLFPETLEILIRREDNNLKKESLENFRKASKHLRQTAANAKICAPHKFVAILRMDGDHISKLILGDPEVVKTRWKDVLHPKAVEQVQKNLAETGWPGLLGERRHSGPAFHTAITHSLADFAHKIVAWVVEREFNGRLIYVGGDDLLAILPAVEAVPAAARLQQLYSAPYVLDTQSDIDPWSWRRSHTNDVSNQEEARQRFHVPIIRPESGDIRLPIREFEKHATGTSPLTDLPDGRCMALYTMLGRQNSLSAGIAIGHYKEPLRLLLNTAGEMLDEVAKETMGRDSVAVALLSSGGRKATFAARWRLSSSSTNLDPPNIQRHLTHVMKAFQPINDSSASDEQDSPSRFTRLSKNLPYALREQIQRMGRVLLDHDIQDQKTSENYPNEARCKMMIQHLLEKVSGIAKDKLLNESMMRLIECGIEYTLKLEKRNSIEDKNLENAMSSSGQLGSVELSDLIIAGFLLARKLSSDGGYDGIS